MKLIIAEEANTIAKENSEDHIVEKIMSRIIERAKNGDFEVKIRDFGFGDSKLYANEMTERQGKVVRKLNELGYRATIETQEKQFVDIYLKIRW